MRLLISIAGLSIGLAATSGAAAVPISLGFSSLPSAQGWTYKTSGKAEATVYSVDGTALYQNTMGTGLGAGGAAYQYYTLGGVVDQLSPFVITVRAKLLDSERSDSGGFSFSAFTGAEAFEIYMDKNKIEDGLHAVLASTGTGFHTYRLVATPGIGYKFSVDGFQVATGLPNFAYAGVPNQLTLGDATSGGNAMVDITTFAVTAVPEPGICFMLAAGVAALGGCRRLLRKDA